MFPDRFKLEMQIQYENVKGTIDIYDKLLHIVIDVKTTKLNIMLKPTRWDQQQLKYYMSLMDSEEGAVIYQMNNASKYLIFPILMNELQRKRHLAKLLEEARSFQHAVDLGDPSLLEGVYDDNERNWLCKKCPYLEACNAIRKNHGNHVEAV